MADRGRQFQRWVSLQRERALTLVSLRDINEKIEGIRPGLPPNPPLDNFTIKLGGTSERPGVTGLWIESYLKQALAERIIDEDEVVA